MGKKRKYLDFLGTDVDESKVRGSIEYKPIFWICFPLQFIYAWIYPTILKGYRKPLSLEDLPRLHKSFRSDHFVKYFDRVWKFFDKPILRNIRLVLTIYVCFGCPYIIAGFFQLIYTGLVITYPLFMEYLLLQFNPLMSPSDKAKYDEHKKFLPKELRPPDDIAEIGYRTGNDMGWVWLFVLVLSIAFAAIFHQFCIYLSAKVGLKIRSVLTAKIYHKALKLSNKARTIHEDGRIMNYVSTDCSKLDHYHQHFHDSWSCLIIVVVLFYFIIRLIGYGIVASLCLSIFLVPACILLGIVFWKLRKKHLSITDRRLARMNEVFQGIKIIKCFTWESSYLNIINKVRNSEILMIRIAFIFASALKCVILCIPNLMTAAGFFTYFFVYGELDNVTIYTTIVYFNAIRTPLISLPVVLTRFLEGFISYMRLQKFLDAEEREDRVNYENDEVPIIIKEGNFQWEKRKEKKEVKKTKKEEIELLEKGVEEKNEEQLERERKMELSKTLGRLKDINLEVKKGELVMIVGEVGSGKSSLFSAILGEMRKISGSVELSGNVCYCDQTPFVLNGTMRENILFGEEYKKVLFNEVLRVCRLDKDLDEDYFEGGEMVEIGEKGVNLSGGQKYRVQLARACYCEGDVYLLDDPLAAVDSACGKHIFRECIQTFLGDKTRVVITHQLNYCENADRIIFLKNGKIVENGTFDELMSDGKEFAKLVGEHFEEGETTSTLSSNYNEFLIDSDSDDELINSVGGEEEIVINENSTLAHKGIQTDHVELKELFLLEKKKLLKKSKRPTKLIIEEERMVGSLPVRVVFSYLSAMPGGLVVFLIICCCYIVTEIMFLGADVFLVYFSAQNVFPDQTVVLPMMTNYSSGSNISSFYPYPCTSSETIKCSSFTANIYWEKRRVIVDAEEHKIRYGEIDSDRNVVLLGVYGAFSVLVIGALFVVSLLTLNLLLFASASIFRKVLKKLIFATVGFFDSQPIGRIISRLSGDVQLLDLELNFCIDVFLALFAAVVGACGMIAFITKGMFIPPIFVIALIYFFVFQFYRKTSRELKRLNSVAKSPLLSSVSESLTGLTTIRAYGLQNFFKKKNHRYIDLFNRSQYLLFTANRWLEVTLNIIGSWTILAAGICALVIAYVDVFEPIRPSKSFLSLCVTDAVIISSLLSSIVFMLTNIEIQMNAVERLEYYVENVPQEGTVEKKEEKKQSDSEYDFNTLDSSIPDTTVNSSSEEEEEKVVFLDYHTKERLGWINHGRIEFQDFCMRYRKNTRLVLRKVNFVVHPKERIGIIGDTGSGKTSLMNSILRFVESSHGKILVDGVDISRIPLLVLRREISIIPQEPVLFKGTLRSNLDPFNEYSDEEILEALVKSNLKTLVEYKLKKGVRSKVAEGGRNFSVGERQLFCLARAILKKTKILIMDECTASVDYETDQFIQNTIREEFGKNCTVLTIAHRLQTVLDYDRILVMSSGKVEEFDTPYNLIKKQERSQFYNLLTENPNPGNLLSQIVENRKTRPVKRRFVDWEVNGEKANEEIQDYKKRNKWKKKNIATCLGLV